MLGWMHAAVVCVIVAGTVATAHAQSAPYDDKLNLLAERLGAIHYLRNLCAEPNNAMREQMSAILTSEQPDEARRARLVASFNRGYRTFRSVYATCTDQARTIADDYVAEAQSMSRDLVNIYASQ